MRGARACCALCVCPRVHVCAQLIEGALLLEHLEEQHARAHIEGERVLLLPFASDLAKFDGTEEEAFTDTLAPYLKGHDRPLTVGDIEDVNGHPCVLCPWHHYKVRVRVRVLVRVRV